MSALTLIQTVTVGSGGAASITFGTGGTIPQTFTDLLIVTSLRTNRTAANAGWANYIAFNGSEANITNRELRGTGSSALSDASSAAYVIGNSSDRTASTFGNSSLYIPNYRRSIPKSFSIDGVEENNGASAIMTLLAGLWNQTAAITSITIRGNQNDLMLENSSASLYGILAGSSGGVVVS